MDEFETHYRRRINALPLSGFAVAALEWLEHKCDPQSDVCGCTFRFPCTQCGTQQVCFGESMPQLIGIGGKCEGCYYGVPSLAGRFA